MRRINKEELKKYFELAMSRKDKPDNYDSEEDINLVRSELRTSGFIDSLIDVMNSLRKSDGDKSASGTLWMTGFQMGREYESRHREQRELMVAIGEASRESGTGSDQVIVTKPDKYEDSDVLVCALEKDIRASSDPRLTTLQETNLKSTCIKCGESVVYRPTAPVGPIKMCMVCALQMKNTAAINSSGEVN